MDQNISDSSNAQPELTFNIDWLLQDIVHQANTSDKDLRSDLILTCHGFLISGTVISGKEFFRQMAKESNIKSTKEYFEATSEELYTVNNEESASLPVYIHLTDAKFYHPNGKYFPQEGTLWRGKLTEIAGFAFGKIESEK